MKVLGLIWRITRRLIWETATDNTTGLAAQMAYTLLIALAPRTALFLAYARPIRDRPRKAARYLWRPEEFYASRSQSVGHSRCRCRERGRDRFERITCQRRHFAWDLLRHDLHRDHIAGAQPH